MVQIDIPAAFVVSMLSIDLGRKVLKEGVMGSLKNNIPLQERQIASDQDTLSHELQSRF